MTKDGLLGAAILALALAGCPGAGSAPRVSFDPLVAFDRRDDAMAQTMPPNKPAVRRKQPFAGFNEQFNRHYTDPDYTPATVVYVSPTGNGNGASPSSPASVREGLSKAAPGTRVVFQRGTYQGCFEVGKDGTYDAPIVLYAEKNPDGSRGVRMQCCGHGRASCFNFEGTSYVAVDGFELRGGRYGVRAVGGDYAASQHTWGIAVLHCRLDGQGFDGVLTGAVDWSVFEDNVVSNSGEDDGHGIYLSNGSDLNIVRNNDLFDNMGATFQINADPASTCDGDFRTEDCDAVAGTGDGGRGASDFFLVENNYFHHGDAQGSNFTSVRYSMVRNNVFASWGRHGVSFWSEAADPADKRRFNPRLGSHHNRVYHNLFASTNDRHMLQFVANSDSCDVRNNLFVGMTVSGDRVSARPTATWLETDNTVTNNVYEHNVYLAGRFDGRRGPGVSELARPDLDPAWFTRLPTGLPSTVTDFQPKPGAPFLDIAPRLPSVMLDRAGKPRGVPADVGPFEL
ncbi:MAG: right-handed parallel beta-helix repeat-containing protein [Labilithrix sp.]|nr:right-handed parallel beta-helix repeat-containing protein [Labilithrix sp.]MCW5813302.1 right-handed parallel beta-helix repeat-containing protein [Labilithrix sp.]